MALEKSQVKFAKSDETGELIGFVSRHSKTKKLKGVRENSVYGKQICVLSQDLKGLLTPNILYEVELKAMHNNKGYVVVSATPLKFKAKLEYSIVRNAVYQIRICFGNKIIYFDPKDGRSPSSKTVEGVLAILSARQDIEELELLIEKFRREAKLLLAAMRQDGYYINTDMLK